MKNKILFLLIFLMACSENTYDIERLYLENKENINIVKDSLVNYGLQNDHFVFYDPFYDDKKIIGNQFTYIRAHKRINGVIYVDFCISNIDHTGLFFVSDTSELKKMYKMYKEKKFEYYNIELRIIDKNWFAYTQDHHATLMDINLENIDK
ncbi:MAG: hypothetical protein EAZ97_15620 [Bacteroidetes bacterium]|nr:MAG: hypothetical protein EAZ97_15620 [Bacteroidota bacterium]